MAGLDTWRAAKGPTLVQQWSSGAMQNGGTLVEPIVTSDGLGTVGVFNFVSCLSSHALSQHSCRPGCSGLFRLMLLALFVSSATPLLTPPWLKDGVRFGDRDGFSIF